MCRHEHSNRWSHDLCDSSVTIERRLELRPIYLQSGQYVHAYAHPNTDCKPYRGSESNTECDADTAYIANTARESFTEPHSNARNRRCTTA